MSPEQDWIWLSNRRSDSLEGRPLSDDAIDRLAARFIRWNLLTETAEVFLQVDAGSPDVFVNGVTFLGIRDWLRAGGPSPAAGLASNAAAYNIAALFPDEPWRQVRLLLVIEALVQAQNAAPHLNVATGFAANTFADVLETAFPGNTAPVCRQRTRPVLEAFQVWWNVYLSQLSGWIAEEFTPDHGKLRKKIGNELNEVFEATAAAGLARHKWNQRTMCLGTLAQTLPVPREWLFQIASRLVDANSRGSSLTFAGDDLTKLTDLMNWMDGQNMNIGPIAANKSFLWNLTLSPAPIVVPASKVREFLIEWNQIRRQLSPASVPETRKMTYDLFEYRPRISANWVLNANLYQ